MEYIVEFRVHQGDNGHHYRIQFSDQEEPTISRPYRSERTATSAGLRKLATMIDERRTAEQAARRR